MIDIEKNSFFERLVQDYQETLQFLLKNGYTIPALPNSLEAITEEGEAYSLSYPIQGVLKYHGMVDSKQRISYFPSISFNNSCAFTITYLKFDKTNKKDRVILNGKEAFGREFERVEAALNLIRFYAKTSVKATLVSRNCTNLSSQGELGKGLGTSASGSAALAQAAISILYNNSSEYVNNNRLVSTFSRYLSGSGTRSAAGGFSLWLSHPKIDPLDCFAIRLDNNQHQDLIDQISLITIPIESKLKTEQAHQAATKSPFFYSWGIQRKSLILEFIEALNKKDFNKIGELAEFDTHCLHAVAMTAKNGQELIAWDPDTVKIMLMVRELREQGYNLYYSIDTGPTVVLITQEKEKKDILYKLNSIIPYRTIMEGKIGGSSKIISPNSKEAKLLERDIHIALKN